MQFSRVDLPAPFPPITVTNSPASKVRSTSSTANFSLILPIEKVLLKLRISSIIFNLLVGIGTGAFLPGHETFFYYRAGKSDGYYYSRDQLEVGGRHAQVQSDGNYQAVQHGSQYHRKQAAQQGTGAKEHFSDNYRGQ